jgi:hypothetical protein
MFESRETKKPVQSQFWIETSSQPKVPASTFYPEFDETLDHTGFTGSARNLPSRLCRFLARRPPRY